MIILPLLLSGLAIGVSIADAPRSVPSPLQRVRRSQLTTRADGMLCALDRGSGNAETLKAA